MMILETVRPFMAILMWMIFISCFTCWMSIHGLFPFWRKAGIRLTYSVHLVFLIIIMTMIYINRDFLIGFDLGWNMYLTIAGGILWICSSYLETKTRQKLSLKTLIGVPEIDPNHAESTLLTGGIYARIRNPRYVLVSIHLLGWSLIVNYSGMYILLLITLVLIYVVVLLEERELKTRFGRQYEIYCQTVPRFFPKWKP